MRYEDYLVHHGRMGQKWGVRNGPPYPLRLGGKSYGSIMKKKKKVPAVDSKEARDGVDLLTPLSAPSLKGTEAFYNSLRKAYLKDPNSALGKYYVFATKMAEGNLKQIEAGDMIAVPGLTKSTMKKSLETYNKIVDQAKKDLMATSKADKSEYGSQKPGSAKESKSVADRAKEFLQQSKEKSQAKKAQKAEQQRQEAERQAEEARAAKEQERKDFLNNATAKQLKERQNEYSNEELEYAIQRIKKKQTISQMAENEKSQAKQVIQKTMSTAKNFNDFTKTGIEMYNNYAVLYNTFVAKTEAEKKKVISKDKDKQKKGNNK